MQTLVTARHCAIPDTLRGHARSVLARVARVAHRPQRGQVVFDLQRQQKAVELQLHLPRGIIRVARAEAADFRSALDRAAEKLRHQLEKTHVRYVRRKVTR